MIQLKAVLYTRMTKNVANVKKITTISIFPAKERQKIAPLLIQNNNVLNVREGLFFKKAIVLNKFVTALIRI